MATLVLTMPTREAQTQGTNQCSTAPQTSVPAFVAAAATGTVADFASALAQAGICAGVVVGDDIAGEVTRSWRHEPREPAGRLQEAIDVVQRTHPGLSIQQVGPILLVRDKRLNLKVAPFTKQVVRFELHDVRMVEALRRIVDQVAPGSAPPLGRPGSSLRRPDEPPPSSDDLEGPVITTVLANVTFLDGLVNLAGKAPGTVWMATAAAQDATSERRYQVLVFLRRGLRHVISTRPIQ